MQVLTEKQLARIRQKAKAEGIAEAAELILYGNERLTPDDLPKNQQEIVGPFLVAVDRMICEMSLKAYAQAIRDNGLH